MSISASHILYDMRVLDSIMRSAYNESGVFFQRTVNNKSKNHSYLQIKRSVTNMFVTFVVGGNVLFSCTAGSSGLVKKERRLRRAAYEAGTLFGKFVSGYILRSKATAAFLFRNVIAVLHAPISFLRLFLFSFKASYTKLVRKLSKKMRIKNNKNVKKEKKLLIRKYKRYELIVRRRIHDRAKYYLHDAYTLNYLNVLKYYSGALYVHAYKKWLLASAEHVTNSADVTHTALRNVCLRNVYNNVYKSAYVTFCNMYSSVCHRVVNKCILLNASNGNPVEVSFQHYYGVKYSSLLKYLLNANSYMSRPVSFVVSSLIIGNKISYNNTVLFWIMLSSLFNIKYYISLCSSSTNICNAYFIAMRNVRLNVRLPVYVNYRYKLYNGSVVNKLVNGKSRVCKYVLGSNNTSKGKLSVRFRYKGIRSAFKLVICWFMELRIPIPVFVMYINAMNRTPHIKTHYCNRTTLSFAISHNVNMYYVQSVSSTHEMIHIWAKMYLWLSITYRNIVHKLHVATSIIPVKTARTNIKIVRTDMRNISWLNGKLKSIYIKNKRMHGLYKFKIRMLSDQSTFPFNGCRGKRRS